LLAPPPWQVDYDSFSNNEFDIYSEKSKQTIIPISRQRDDEMRNPTTSTAGMKKSH